MKKNPPSLLHRHSLAVASTTAQALRAPAVFTLLPSAKQKEDAKLEALKITAELLCRIHALEAERAALINRQHREERVKLITVREVDRRHAWRAKMGLRGSVRTCAVITARSMSAVDTYLPNVSE